MNIKYRIFAIEYDTTDTDGDIPSLPKQLEMTLNDTDCLIGTTANLEELLSDYISDTTGFCHNGFQYERMN